MSPPVGSTYRAAIECTAQTIRDRARIYRGLMIIVALVGIASPNLALISHTVGPLALLGTLAPLLAGYLFLDARSVQGWRRRLCRAWVALDIEFCWLAEALRADRSLPQTTLRGMLALLPAVDRPPLDGHLSPATRHAVLAAVALNERVLLFRLAMQALVLTLAMLAVSAAALLGDWRWLLGGAPAAPLWLLPRLVWTDGLAAAQREIEAMRLRPDFDGNAYRAVVTALDWDDWSPRNGRHGVW
jgi:hypothetical protein